MLVSMSDKELKRLSVLQEICDQRMNRTGFVGDFLFKLGHLT
ncbi:hypothetical protein [Acinetobacter sp. AR2-3]|nr:hypothetical protein [Acinetobacter sp. AR2-3]